MIPTRRAGKSAPSSSTRTQEPGGGRSDKKERSRTRQVKFSLDKKGRRSEDVAIKRALFDTRGSGAECLDFFFSLQYSSTPTATANAITATATGLAATANTAIASGFGQSLVLRQ